MKFKQGCFVFCRILILFFLIIACAKSFASAENASGNEQKTEKKEEKTVAATATMEDIVVTGKVESSATGKSVLSDDMIRSLLSGNGSINEIIEILPDVQVSDEKNFGENSGEIKPINISISGGRFYENNFTIDGIENNSLLDPACAKKNQINDVAGHSQELFIGSELIKEILVYDSNVPAEYGSFTGGVVEAKTKDPGFDWSGSLKLRGTGSSWTNYHIRKNEDFDLSKQEPEFKKREFTASVSGSFNEKSGMIATVRQLSSSTPEDHFTGSKSIRRRSESYFLKYTNDLTDISTLSVSLAHSPYHEENFIKDVKDSDYTLKGGGIVSKAIYNKYLPGGELKLKTSLSESENSRNAPQHYFSWAASDSKPWGKEINGEKSKEGGFGDIEKKQRKACFHADYALNEFNALKSGHSLKSGIGCKLSTGSFKRKELSYLYSGVASGLPNLECRPEQEIDCVPGEQFFVSRKLYSPDEAKVRINGFSGYIQDKIKAGPVTINPGIRLDYNDYMKNLDISPRFSLSFDTFNNGSTIVTAGANRYYSRCLMTCGLREAIKPFKTQIRHSYHNVVQEWEDASGVGTNATKFSRLKTPYSDEAALGIDQKLLKGKLSLKYVRRRGHDEFARNYAKEPEKDGIRYYTMTNQGESSHKSYRVSWNRSFKRHKLLLTCNYQETNTSNKNYDSSLEEVAITDLVWSERDGRAMPRAELPKGNYNRPVTASVVYSGKFSKGFAFTNIIKYSGHYKNLEDTGKKTMILRNDETIGEWVEDVIPVYGDVSYSSHLTFDWKLSWKQKFKNKAGLKLFMEIENVFDTYQKSDKFENKYLKGRQIWGGCSVFF